jgi:hypothetical protein
MRNRHGTLSLCPALHTGGGKVIGQTSAHHTSAEFVAFLEALVARQPQQRSVHIICDNLSAHKTKAVCDFLTRHLKVPLIPHSALDAARLFWIAHERPDWLS